MERAIRSRMRQKTSWLIPTLSATLVITWYPPLKSCTNANAVCAFHMSPPPPFTGPAPAIIEYKYKSVCVSIHTYELGGSKKPWNEDEMNRQLKGGSQHKVQNLLCMYV